MSSLAKQHYAAEQYLALEREADYKSEYVNGQIYAMSGASKEHVTIAVNLTGELYAQLKGKPCSAYTSDMRVRVNPTGMSTYPDVSVVCGEPRFDDEQLDTLTNPNVIIEVLSPSTEAAACPERSEWDRGEKFAHYRRLQSLSDYVLVAQDKVRVEHFARSSERGDQWLLTEFSDLDQFLTLTSIGCTITLRDIYDKVEFPNSERMA